MYGTKCEVTMAGYCSSSIFYVFIDRDGVDVHINSQQKQQQKKRMRPISSHLDQTSLVNRGFIIWLSRKYFLRQTAGSPERAR